MGGTWFTWLQKRKENLPTLDCNNNLQLHVQKSKSKAKSIPVLSSKRRIFTFILFILKRVWNLHSTNCISNVLNVTLGRLQREFRLQQCEKFSIELFFFFLFYGKDNFRYLNSSKNVMSWVDNKAVLPSQSEMFRPQTLLRLKYL